MCNFLQMSKVELEHLGMLHAANQANKAQYVPITSTTSLTTDFWCSVNLMKCNKTIRMTKCIVISWLQAKNYIRGVHWQSRKILFRPVCINAQRHPVPSHTKWNSRIKTVTAHPHWAKMNSIVSGSFFGQHCGNNCMWWTIFHLVSFHSQNRQGHCVIGALMQPCTYRFEAHCTAIQFSRTKLYILW